MAEVWSVFWQQPLAEEETLWRVLPPARRERLAKEGGHRQQALCAYGLLRLALWERFGLRELPAIALADRGKPCFPAFPALHFSISHTDGAALVGLSGAPVGVDIEKYRPVGRRTMARLGRGMTEEEFLCSWVRREAIAKQSGVGLADAMRETLPTHKDVNYLSLDAAPGYFAGIAFADTPPVNQHRRSLEDLIF